MPDDYEMLQRLGVSLKGKIVISRYGSGWRDLKPKLAIKHGAVGGLVYFDPADDNQAIDTAYPAGRARPRHGFQRGSVQDMTRYPGGPLTPDIGATGDAKRLAVSDAPAILKFPALLISTRGASRPVLPA